MAGHLAVADIVIHACERRRKLEFLYEKQLQVYFQNLEVQQAF